MGAEAKVDFVGSTQSLDSTLARIEKNVQGLSGKLTGALGAVTALFSVEKLKTWGTQILNVAAQSDEFKGRVEGIWGALEAVQLSIAEYLIPILETTITTGVRVFTALQVAIQNWDDTTTLAVKSVQLGFIAWYEDIKHFFTVALPQYLSWFGDNWTNVFVDAANFTSTVVMNMYDNLVNFFTNVFNWLQGNETDWQWKSLTEGFQKTMDDLPEIARRAKTDVEKELEADIGGLTTSFKDKFEKQLQINLKAIGFDEESINKRNPGVVTQGLDALGGMLSKLGDAIDAIPFASTKESQEKESSGQQSNEALTALFSRIQNASLQVRGIQAQEKTAEAAVQQVIIQSKIQKATQDSANFVGQMAGSLSNVLAGGIPAVFGK